jgi:hypothetical protein
MLSDIMIFWTLSYCETEVVASARESPSALWGGYPVTDESDISRKASSGDFFSVGTREGARLCCPAHNYRRSAGRTSCSCNDGHVKAYSRKWPCGAVPSALKWTAAASNTYCNYESPVV